MLESKQIIQSYAPVYDVKNSYTAQYEHTIYVSEKATNILSLGDDY